jgi:F0F1-type ATP synthase assembly protein I
VKQDWRQINQTAYMASVVGQVGCLTVLVIAAALGGGLLLDNFLETKPLFTIVFVIGSVPVTLFLIVRVTLSAASRARLGIEDKTEEEAKE